MTRETEPAPSQARKDDDRADDPPPDKRREDEPAEADHRFRDWALI